MAEYRELPRIFGNVRNAVAKKKQVNDISQPLKYTMGRGHMLFFYSRLRWCLNRQKLLIEECLRRGFKIVHTNPDNLIEGIPEEWCGDWTADLDAVCVNMKRILERENAS
jgi:deoxyribonuclease (pyrimidine dimer)